VLLMDTYLVRVRPIDSEDDIEPSQKTRCAYAGNSDTLMSSFADVAAASMLES
jgi:hypothetical protein